MKIHKSKNKKSYYSKFKIPLYDLDCHVIVGKTMKQACKQFDRIFKGNHFSKDSEISNSVAYAVRMVSENYSTFVLLFSEEEFKHYDKHSIIAHESLHISYFIVDCIGLNPTFENHESQAYIIENIVLNVNKIIK